MKTFEEAYTPEQLEALRTTYYIDEEELYGPDLSGGTITRDNLKIVDVKAEVVLTAEDFNKDDNDDDYTYIYDKDGNWDCLARREVPDEVAEILDAVIDEKKSR